MLKWGIAGTGQIARAFALALNRAENCRACGVAGRRAEKAAAFAAELRVERAYSSVEQMCADPEIEAVYVCPPHPFHAEWARCALKQGKHVLCEKPMALGMEEIHEMQRLAREQGVLLLEGYMYRCHPQTAKLVELLKAGAVGRVRSVEGAFSFRSEFNPASRLFDPALGGGAIWDIGGYPLSMANLVAAASSGNAPVRPERLEAVGVWAENGIDLLSTALVCYPAGIVGRLTVSLTSTEDNSLRIYGEGGKIVVPDPWVCDRVNPPQGRILLTRSGEAAEVIEVPCDRTSFTLEAEYFASLAAQGKTDAVFPVMSAAETVLQNELLQEWERNAAGK